MKARDVGIGLGVLLIVVIAEIGWHQFKKFDKPASPTPNRVVTIRTDPDNDNLCEVDYSIALLHTSKSETIAWAAVGHEYWVKFLSSNPVSGSPIHIDKDKQIDDIKVPAVVLSKSYSYEIWKNTPQPYQPPCSAGAQGHPCKCGDDLSQPTGLIIKP